MHENDLRWFASGFRTVAAWYDAMRAHDYSMPLQLCHGLDQAMTRLNLTFPEAFRLLWDKKKILVSGRALIYDESARMLWQRGEPPLGASASLAQDVLAQVPPTKDILHLESVWRLAANSSPLELLELWQPTDEDDQCLRRFLLDFGRRVLAAERRNSNV